MRSDPWRMAPRLVAVIGLGLGLYFAAGALVPPRGCSVPVVDALRKMPTPKATPKNPFDEILVPPRSRAVNTAGLRACISSARNDVARSSILVALAVIGAAVSVRILRPSAEGGGPRVAEGRGAAG